MNLMNTKDLITFAVAALVFTLVFQFFMSRHADRLGGDQLVSGQKITAPKALMQVPELHKPLNREVDFVDTAVERPEVTTMVDTPLMNLVFSNNGAVIQSVIFKRVVSDNVEELTTFSLEPAVMDRERGTFLLALDERTPYYYDLVNDQEAADGRILTYQVTSDSISISKQFKIYHDKHQVDLTITMQSAAERQVRLFIPGPFLPHTASQDVVQALMNNPKNIVEKEPRDEQLTANYWPAPTLFGAEDRYFIHALVNDNDDFALRGFYALKGERQLTSIIEGHPLKDAQPRAWKMSFYMGPKEVAALNNVDPRLDVTLDYGFWAPISKVILSTMKFIHHYLPNYGLVIILLTLLIKLLLMPFGMRQGKTMKSRKELQRKIAYIEQKYKNDRETLMREKAELIRKHGMPDMLGCLPLLVQFPLFWALNRVLNTSIELFRAPFGWIADLSAPDPWYILPILIAVGMMFSLAAVGDVRQRLPFFLMSLILAAVTANLAAGLSLFIATSTWLTVAENRFKKALNV